MRKSKILLAATMCCTMLAAAGCSSKNKTTDYSKYVKLGEYKGIEVTVNSTDVTDEDVTNRINSMLEGAASMEEVKDRAVKKDDTVNIDYKGTVDGKEFEGGSDEKYDLTIGSKRFIDDFEDQLIGHKIGETVEVKVTFPEEYEQNKDLQGKDAVFTVKINGIKEKKVPELTDAWVTSYTEKDETPVKTVDEFKKNVRETIKTQKEDQAATNKTADVLTAIVDNSEISGYPEKEINEYVDNMKSYYEAQATRFGTDFESLIKMYGMDEKQFEEETKKMAEATVARQMVCKEIAEKENMKISDEEYKKGLEDYAKKYSTDQKTYTPEEFEKQYGKDVVEENLLLEKVLTFITDNAVEVPAQETEKTEK